LLSFTEFSKKIDSFFQYSRHLILRYRTHIAWGSVFFGTVLLATLVGYHYQQQTAQLLQQKQSLESERSALESQLETLKNEDQRVRNDTLAATLNSLQETNTAATKEYDRLLDLQAKNYDTSDMEVLWAQILAYLAENN